ncbi:hypothetical protein NQ317_004762, partial [Molorchus minor]
MTISFYLIEWVMQGGDNYPILKILHAEGDADNLIVNKSVELRSTQNSVTLVGEDTDLMVLLIFKVKVDNVYMLRPGSSTKPDKNWIGNTAISPTQWGWKRQNNILKPVTTEKAIASDFILKLVFCNCKADCRNFCSCRNANINCFSLCGQCQGNSCSNVYKEEESLDEEL